MVALRYGPFPESHSAPSRSLRPTVWTGFILQSGWISFYRLIAAGNRLPAYSRSWSRS